jgi:YidC/Oxa1 family membrane protein insertase
MILSTVSLSFTNFIQVGFGFVFKWLYDLTSNYALTLFLFALVVKVILLPLSAKQKKTMMKTSRLAPQLKALEIACGDDKAKYQQEMMALYKEEGVSMTGGCVWSLIPMFILIPLYYVIREPLTYVLRMDTTDLLALKAGAGTANAAYWQLAVAHNAEAYQLQHVRHQPCHGSELEALEGVLLERDRAVPDPGRFGRPEPCLHARFAEDEQYRHQGRQGESDKDAAATANKTGKSMMYMMPLMSVFFGFIMPAGLSIYWIAQAVFGIVQDYFLTVHYRKIYDAEDAVKREKAAQKALEEAEKEKLRAQRRAENPEGILENTSKKKLEQKQRMEREAAAREYAARTAPETQPSDAPADAARPFSRGRAYQADRYRDNGDAEEETKE